MHSRGTREQQEPPTVIANHLDEIHNLCRTHRVRRLRVFGSVVRGEFDPARSDVDMLVEFFDVPFGQCLRTWYGLKWDLQDVCKCRIDLLMPGAIRNPYVRATIEKELRLLYEA